MKDAPRGILSSLPPLPHPPFASLPRTAGILFTMAATLALEMLSAAGVPIPLPAVLLMLGVIYATYLGGAAVGLATGALALVYDIYHVVVTGTVLAHAEQLMPRIISIAIITVVIVVFVSKFRKRLDELLVRERSLLKAAETGREGLESALHHIERAQKAVRFQAKLLDVVSQPVIAIDAAGRVAYWNQSATRLLGWTDEQTMGRSIEDLLPGVPLRLNATTESSMEIDIARGDGTRMPVLIADSPVVDSAGRPHGIVRTISDLTTHQQAERSQRLLADASSALSSSFDYEATVRTVARLCVPAFADCCIVDLLTDDGSSRRLEVAHRDPSKQKLAFTMRPHAITPESPHPVSRVILTGQPVFIARIDARLQRSIAHDEEQLDAMRALAFNSAIIVPLRGVGKVLGAMGFFRDGGSRRFDQRDTLFADELGTRASVAIQQSRLFEEARGANKAKSDFLAVMSHELRTPLTTVTGYTDLMLAGVPEPLPEKAEAYVRRIRVAAGHLLGLIEQILVYTRLDIGREQPHPERLHVIEIVREAASLIEPVSAERGIRFRVEPVDPSLVLETDPTMIRQILLNLLSNAVKFTDRGEVSLSARRDGNDIVFAVHDTGIGIAAEHVEHIFDPFWQVDQSATRRAGGTGLGLSVTRRLARFLGGEVMVESQVGRGSTFIARLPGDWSLDPLVIVTPPASAAHVVATVRQP
ncbi:MAG: ATP-binding protein [Longimicrobiales bacterium]